MPTLALACFSRVGVWDRVHLTLTQSFLRVEHWLHKGRHLGLGGGAAGVGHLRVGEFPLCTNPCPVLQGR